jgi:hypothetical protein
MYMAYVPGSFQRQDVRPWELILCRGTATSTEAQLQPLEALIVTGTEAITAA